VRVSEPSPGATVINGGLKQTPVPGEKPLHLGIELMHALDIGQFDKSKIRPLV
jgi:hypothetical protein